MNTQESITLRLSGTDVPPGEIALSDLASIAGALQLLATRMGRQLVGQTGPGRAAGGAERATRLTLTGITEGSTRLQVTAGAADTLDMNDPFEEQVMDRLWEVFGGLESDVPPDWATVRSRWPLSRSSALLARRPASASSLVDEDSGSADASPSGRKRSTGTRGRR